MKGMVILSAAGFLMLTGCAETPSSPDYVYDFSPHKLKYSSYEEQLRDGSLVGRLSNGEDGYTFDKFHISTGSGMDRTQPWVSMSTLTPRFYSISNPDYCKSPNKKNFNGEPYSAGRSFQALCRKDDLDESLFHRKPMFGGKVFQEAEFEDAVYQALNDPQLDLERVYSDAIAAYSEFKNTYDYVTREVDNKKQEINESVNLVINDRSGIFDDRKQLTIVQSEHFDPHYNEDVFRGLYSSEFNNKIAPWGVNENPMEQVVAAREEYLAEIEYTIYCLNLPEWHFSVQGCTQKVIHDDSQIAKDVTYTIDYLKEASLIMPLQMSDEVIELVTYINGFYIKNKTDSPVTISRLGVFFNGQSSYKELADRLIPGGQKVRVTDIWDESMDAVEQKLNLRAVTKGTLRRSVNMGGLVEYKILGNSRKETLYSMSDTTLAAMYGL